jgi:hypothetical protein
VDGEMDDSLKSGKVRSISRALIIALGPVLAFIVMALAAQGQSLHPVASAPVVREIDDPHTGDRWLLIRDAGRPGAPGRMVLAGHSAEQSGMDLSGRGLRAELTVPVQIIKPRVIRSGDQLVVEEHSAVVSARFEANALGDAHAGSFLNVRLTANGKVVRAVAVGAGLAMFAPSQERQR